MSSNSIKKPILVGVLQAYAAISVIAGAAVGFLGMSENVAYGVLIIAGSVGQAIVVLGVAECVSFLARTADSTERMAGLLARQERGSGGSTFQSKPAKDEAWEKAQRGE